MWSIDGMRIGRGIEVLGESPPRCLFVHHKSHMNWPGIEPGPRLWKAGDKPPEILHVFRFEIRHDLFLSDSLYWGLNDQSLTPPRAKYATL
jgi:hypothetical protein